MIAFKRVSIFVLILVNFQCNSSKIIYDKTPNFKILSTYAEDFVGGRPGNSGTVVIMTIENQSQIQPDSLYYEKRIAKIEVRKTEEGEIWIGRFQKITRKEPNLNEDSNENLILEIPEAENYPFDLKNNQAVVKYFDKNKPCYFLINEIIIKPTLFYP